MVLCLNHFQLFLSKQDEIEVVDVLCGFPNFPEGKFLDGSWKSLFNTKIVNGVRINYVFVIPSNNKSNFKRIINYTSYLVSSFLKGLVIKKPDVIVATSPPIFAALSGLLVAKIKGSKFVLDVRDIWPESAVQMGSIKHPFIISLLEKLELFLYRNSSLITVATPGMVQLVKNKLEDVDIPIEYVPCGVTIPESKALSKSIHSPFFEKDKGKSCVLYAGLHGHAQNLTTLIDAAKILEHRDDIVFYFVGAGPDKDRVTEYAKELDLTNVRFISPVTRETIRQFFVHSTCAIVPLRDLDIFKNVFPSKTFELMSYGVPSVVGVGGEIEKIIISSGAGQAVSPECASEYAEAIVKFVDQPEYRKLVSERAIKTAKEQFDYDVVNKRFANLVIKLLSGSE